MRRLWDRIPSLARGLGIVAVIAIVVVVLSLEPVVATVGGILQIAFFLAIALFLFLVWRERRGDLEAWSEWNRKLFYAAVVLAVRRDRALDRLRPAGQPRRARPRAGRGRLRVRDRARLAHRAPLLRLATAARSRGPGAGSAGAGFTGWIRRIVYRYVPALSRRVPRSAWTSSPTSAEPFAASFVACVAAFSRRTQ